MRVIPVGDYVVVKRQPAASKSTGGILLPDAGKSPSQEGRVLSVGDGRLLDCGARAPLQVAEGDRVLFASYAGAEVAVDGDDLLILRESDILAVLE